MIRYSLKTRQSQVKQKQVSRCLPLGVAVRPLGMTPHCCPRFYLQLTTFLLHSSDFDPIGGGAEAVEERYRSASVLSFLIPLSASFCLVIVPCTKCLWRSTHHCHLVPCWGLNFNVRIRLIAKKKRKCNDWILDVCQSDLSIYPISCFYYLALSLIWRGTEFVKLWNLYSRF